MEARIGAMEATMMVQLGALSESREQAEAHRNQMSLMMKDLCDTVTHLQAVKEHVEASRARVPVPPGFAGADLTVTRTPTKAATGQGAEEDPSRDPWVAATGRASTDPWASSSARQRGSRTSSPEPAEAAKAEPEEANVQALLLSTLQQLLSGSQNAVQGERAKFEPKKYLDDRQYKRMDNFAGDKDCWSEWSFVFKAITRSTNNDTFQILDWIERQDSPINEDSIPSKFVGVNADKVSGELYDILCTL